MMAASVRAVPQFWPRFSAVALVTSGSGVSGAVDATDVLGSDSGSGLPVGRSADLRPGRSCQRSPGHDGRERDAPPPRPLNDTHADGLAWAKSEGVVDAEACHRIGPRFTAGCLAFVEAELRTRDLQLAEGFSRP